MSGRARTDSLLCRPFLGNYNRVTSELKQAARVPNRDPTYPFSCGQGRISLKVKNIKKYHITNSFHLAKYLYKLKETLYNYFRKGNLEILKRV